MNKWTKEKVIKEIQYIADKEGDIPSSLYCNRLYHAAYRLFGSWDNALISAGFEPHKNHRKYMKWTKENVIREIQDIVSAKGSVPTARDYPALSYAAYRLFGSWSKAIKSAGFEPRYTKNKISNKKCKPSGYRQECLRKFIVCLIVAQKFQTKINSEIIANCMRAVNRGDLDKLDIVFKD